MKTQAGKHRPKENFKHLMKSHNKDFQEVINFVSENVPPKKRGECYDHLYYCFLFSGLISTKDLIIKAKDFTR